MLKFDLKLVKLVFKTPKLDFKKAKTRFQKAETRFQKHRNSLVPHFICKYLDGFRTKNLPGLSILACGRLQYSW